MKQHTHGFTVAELLVTVAIVGILAGVSIPLYSWVVEYNKEKSDNNYVASAKIAYLAEYALNKDFNKNIEYYIPATGGFTTSRVSIDGYGQGTTAGSDKTSHIGKILACTISDDGTVSATWASGALDENEISSVTNTDPAKSLYKGLTANQLKAVSGTGSSLNSTDTSNATVQEITAYLQTIFPNTNITAWRITKETDKTKQTVTITDVDLSTVPAGSKVKVIRYNPNKGNTDPVTKEALGTYTAAYIDVVASSDGYQVMDILDKLATHGWEEIDGQTTNTKSSYASAAKIYNAAPDYK